MNFHHEAGGREGIKVWGEYPNLGEKPIDKIMLKDTLKSMAILPPASRKDDLIAALEHKQPSNAVSIWEIEFQAWDAASGRHMVLGREFEKLTAQEQEKTLHTNAEIILSVAEEMHWSAVSVPGDYWESAPGQLAYYCLPRAARLNQCAILRKLAPEGLMLIAAVGGIIGGNYSEEFCEKMFDEPESIDEIAEKALVYGLELARRFKDLGVDAGFTASDMADNSGPFFKPAQMERWVYPFLRRWTESLRAMGMLSILHSDGNLTPYIDQLASQGLNALQAIDPIAGMDIIATKKRVGDRLCLCGNMDCGRLLLGTPEEIFESTKKLLLACKPGGSFCLGASNAVQAEVPMANYRAMIEAWKLHGSYAR
jgi:uroporphyrinogen decarboxylase